MSRPVVQLRDIRRTYKNGDLEVHAVRGISLDIHPGEFVAIMGASGSGKSTLMNTLGCLDRPTSGSYLLDGVDVASLDREARADLRNQKLGFVFQGFNLLARTSALENVELPMLYAPARIPTAEMKRRALAALGIVGLAERSDHLPSQLSGGQQQRVAIARALVNEPRLLLADEPTGNLDSKTSVEVMGVFQRLNEQGITIVMVTHELDVASYCKRILVVRDGLVVRDEPVAHRLVAADELAKLKTAEQAAKLVADPR